MACVRSNTTGCTSVRASSSKAAVRPAGPAPAITAIFRLGHRVAAESMQEAAWRRPRLIRRFARQASNNAAPRSTEMHRRRLYSRHRARTGQQPELRDGPGRHGRDEWHLADVHASPARARHASRLRRRCPRARCAPSWRRSLAREDDVLATDHRVRRRTVDSPRPIERERAGAEEHRARFVGRCLARAAWRVPAYTFSAPRNSAAAADAGRRKSVSGGAACTRRPPSSRIARSPSVPASPKSCVTCSTVSASSRCTRAARAADACGGADRARRTARRAEGCRARGASARASATICRSPPLRSRTVARRAARRAEAASRPSTACSRSRGAVADVVAHAQMREEVRVLVDDAHAALLGRQRRHVVAAQQRRDPTSARRTPAIVSSSVVFPAPAGPSTIPHAPRGSAKRRRAARTHRRARTARSTAIIARARRAAVPARSVRSTSSGTSARMHEHGGHGKRGVEPVAGEAVVAQHARDLRVVREDHDRAELAHGARPHHDRGGEQPAAGERPRDAPRRAPRASRPACARPTRSARPRARSPRAPRSRTAARRRTASRARCPVREPTTREAELGERGARRAGAAEREQQRDARHGMRDEQRQVEQRADDAPPRACGSRASR